MSIRKLDLNMLWQSYRAALGRKEFETADNRCHAYLQESISKDGMAPAALPVSMRDSQELQHYGVDIFSAAFDEYPASSWTLSRQPVDLLTSLRQHYLNSIIQQVQGSADPQVYNRAATLVKYLCGLVSSPDNYQTIVNMNITSSVLQIGQQCLQIATTRDLAALPAELFTVISFCVIYLHFFYDPNKKWKMQFVQHLSKVPGSMINVSSVDEQVSAFFIGLFNIATAVMECSEEMMRLQCEVLHMFGAIMAGSKKNAGMLLNGKTGALLFTLYRSAPTTKYTRLQAVGGRVIVQAVVTVHNWKLHNHDEEQESTVDVHVLLYGILHSLVPNNKNTEANNKPPAGIDVTKMCLLLDTIPMIINYKNYSRLQLQRQFIKSKCFNSIMSAMATVAAAYPRPSKGESHSKSIQQLCCSCLRALTAIMKCSQQSKEIFSSVIGYTQLLSTIEKLCPINQTILEAVKEMATDGFTKRQPIVICNVDAIIMVCSCFFCLSMSNKLWWLSQLVEIIAPCVNNQQKCCLGGVVSHLLSLLAQCQNGKQQLHCDVTDKLIELIEVLVSHSISSVEMKSFLRLLGPNNEGQLPAYSHTLQELLLKMAIKSTRVFPLHYIDLSASESFISLSKPLNMKTIGGGFTFHAWVSLGPPLSFEASRALKKRMLYHFEASNGAGFQAFFRNSGKLVVATITKKGEFINLYLHDCPLSPSKWYSVCIVHTLSQRLWGHSEVCVYIDGKLIRAEKMKGPELQEYPRGFIGCGPPLKGGNEEDSRLEELLFSYTDDSANHEDDIFEGYTLNISPVETISLQKAKEQYGTEGSLRGFFCSACLFSECLSAAMIASIAEKGPNDLSLFQPRKPDSLHEVAYKLIFYYHAKACHEKECPDLSPLHIPGTAMDADLTAPVYSSWEVKSILRSLGGAKVLIPLLENSSLPVAGEMDNKAGVSLFLKLLLAFLDEDNQNLFLLSNGIAIVGALMEEVPAVQLTVDALGAVQSLLDLAESSDYDSFVPSIYCHLIFNFYIWRRADYNVQSGHVQYISTLVKDHLKMCRSDYGVEFMLTMIQCFYSPGCREPSHLEVEQQKSIRAALFSNIKLYMQKSIQHDEVKVLISATLAIPNCDIQEEILQLILQLLTSGDHTHQLGQSLMLMGTPLLTLLHSKSNLVRQTVTKIMLKLYKSFSHDEGKLSTSFKDGTFAAAMVQMLRYQDTISSTILLSVLDMCTGKSLDNYTDYISNLEICMALLQLLRIADVEVKNTICQQLISLLQLNPHHAVQIAKRPAWEMIFLWLLITDDAQVALPTHIGDQKPDNHSDDVIDGFTMIGSVFSNKEGDQSPGEDKSRLLNTVVELMGHIVWEESLEVIGTEPLYLKHAWCRLLTAVTNFTEKYQTMFSSIILMQKLLYFSLHAVHVSCTGHDTGPDVLAVVSIVAELFEYYCTDYSSHVPQFKTTICSIELLECYISLMRTIGLFAGHCEDFKLIRSTLRMLVACLAADNKQYLALGVSRMEELLQCIGPMLPCADVCYLLHALFSMLQGIKLTGGDESKHYMLLAIRTILIHASDALDISQLYNLPDASANPNFAQEFGAYTAQEEWSQFIASSVIPSSMTYLEEHINPLQESWHTLVTLCNRQLQERDERRLEKVSQQNKDYEVQVLDVFFSQRESAREKFAASCANHIFRKSYFLEQWRITKYSLTGEHGVWNVENKAPRQFTLQVDSTENFSRMRMRLIRDYTTGRHEEASILRDEGYLDTSVVASSDPIEHSLLREARAAKLTASVASDLSEISSFVNDDTLEVVSPSKHKSPGEQLDEKKIKSFDCQFITLVDFTPGMLHITTHNLHFVSDNGIEEFKVSLSDIREIHSRRYHLVCSALELFLVDQTNYFFNFSSQKIATKVYSCISSQHTPNLVYSGIIRPHKLLQASGLTNKWVRHQISNFEYIMQLNTLSGRTYNDLNQYPVFPWVLCDYSSETIDLKDPKYYRDLSKPLGVLNPALEPSVRERYNEFDDPSGEIEKFHYGTHYSNAAGVMHYLIRLEPFAKQHIVLQSGRFDHADRQFFSIPNTWDSIYNSTSDVKELTPEFYYLPEFLTNINKFDLGKLQCHASSLGDVVLPKWAKDPYEFIHIHRQALESDYVSAHLHEWVDLIWGYKQRGEEAVKACNIFYYCTYEGSVDLSSITDEKKKRQLESMINNFGQTPTQLFYEPHPPRLSLQEARKLLAAKFSTSGQNSARSIFENLKELRAFSVEVNNEPLIMVASPTVKLDTIIASGNPELVVTVTKSGLTNTHDWLPFSNNKSKSFTFELDHNIHLDKSQWHFIGAPFTSIVPITHHMFVSSACNKLLVSGGHWDCGFRVNSLEKNKIVRRIIHHTDIVTCVALDKPGERLVTGSCDTTCAVWHFSSQNFLCTKPLQILYGHNSAVVCVDVSVELDTVVSGAKDGMCIVHSLREGMHMHTLKPQHENPSKIKHVAISSSSAKIVVCYQMLRERRNSRQENSWLCLFSINGQLLKSLDMPQALTALVVTDNHFITSSTEMRLTFGHLYNLKQVATLKMQSPIYSLSLTYQYTHLLVGLSDGKLVIVTCGR